MPSVRTRLYFDPNPSSPTVRFWVGFRPPSSSFPPHVFLPLASHPSLARRAPPPAWRAREHGQPDNPAAPRRRERVRAALLVLRLPDAGSRRRAPPRSTEARPFSAPGPRREPPAASARGGDWIAAPTVSPSRGRARAPVAPPRNSAFGLRSRRAPPQASAPPRPRRLSASLTRPPLPPRPRPCRGTAPSPGPPPLRRVAGSRVRPLRGGRSLRRDETDGGRGRRGGGGGARGGGALAPGARGRLPRLRRGRFCSATP